MPIHDALGSVLGGVNSAGALQYQYTYDPFGNLTTSGQPPSGYGNVYGMAGIESDPTGLYRANARYYSPALTRFVSEDPQRGKANLFTYAGNGPIGGSDISGMQDDFGDEPDPGPPPGGISVSFIFDPFGSGSTPPPTLSRQQAIAQNGFTSGTIGMSPFQLVSSQTGGKGQGPSFATIQEAAIAAQPGAVARSRATGNEVYGGIFPAPGGRFTFSGPFDTGKEGGHFFLPNNVVAIYHTHPPEAVGFPSSADLDTASRTGIPGFIFTVPPSGESPASGGIFEYGPGVPGGYQWIVPR